MTTVHRHQVYESLADTIGNTPIVRIERAVQSDANLYGKLEYLNPGGSIKDRIGWYLIEDAEKRNLIKPGDTIVEGTSGNTGVGLAIAAAIKGYRCVFVLPDKMSEQKIKNLRAFGARVIITPTAVDPEDPRSYYSVSKRMATTIPNAFYVDQYNNLANRRCHYETTGPEILHQMPDIDVLIAGIGTGGTVVGIGQYMKQAKPDVKIVAVDVVGSIVYDTFKYGAPRTPAEPYLVEGIGEDFIPDNYDFNQIDDMVRVDDRESFLMTRRLLAKEGIYAGVSSGSALVGATRWLKEQGESMRNKNVLIILPDSGNRYTSKVYDDDWMTEAGFFGSTAGQVSDLMRELQQKPVNLLVARVGDSLAKVIEKLSDAGISQMPIEDELGNIIGIIQEKVLLRALHNQQVGINEPIDPLVDKAVEFIETSDSIELATKMLRDGKVPLIVDQRGDKKPLGIITNIDLLNYLSKR